MSRTRVQRVGQESASLQAFVPWCSSCNSLILRNGEVTWRSELLQRLQEVRTTCKTRNQLLIKFRWFVAGGGATVPFSNEALDEIFKATLGLPREIVKVCDLALIHT